MTVKQLIQSLSEIQDQDTIVMVKGYEGGYDDINDIIPEPITIALNVNDKWYYGKHDKVDNMYNKYIDNLTIVKAIILQYNGSMGNK